MTDEHLRSAAEHINQAITDIESAGKTSLGIAFALFLLTMAEAIIETAAYEADPGDSNGS